MADFKILGGTDPATNVVGQMTQGLGFPLREVDETATGGSVTVQQEEILRATSDTTQEPTATDTPLQLAFGGAQTTGVIDVDAAGTFTFQEEDEFTLRLRLNFGRTGNPGNAIIFARALINGVQIGNPVHAILDDGNFSVPATFEGIISSSVGDVMTIEIMRSSSGADAGGVFAEAAPLPGWLSSPSCLCLFTRSVAVAT